MFNLRKKINLIYSSFFDFCAYLSNGKLINIKSKGKGVSGLLSNFTKSPFIFNGEKYNSFEGFWQSIKFKENDPNRKIAQTLFGSSAKKFGGKVNSNKFYFNGKIINYNSPQSYKLAKDAERERFLQNKSQLNTLLSTSNAKLIHFVEIKDSKSLPRKDFCRILTELRSELKYK